jgi:hypothetical protein
MSQQDLRFYKEMAKEQREQVRLQEEYNEALKMSTSLSSKLQGDIEDAVNSNAALGEKSKTYLNDLKSSISSLSSSKDISKQLVSIEDEKLKISQNHYNLTQAENDELLAQLDVAQKVLNIEEQRVLATEKVSEAATKLSETMGGMFDGIVDSVKEIPVIGKALGSLGEMGTKALKEKLSNAAMKFTTDFRAGLDEGKGTMEALTGAAGGLGKTLSFLANPYVLVAAAVAAVALAGIAAFYKMSAAAKQFREETGLLNSQTVGLEAQIGKVYSATAPLGASMEDVASAASSFTQAFGGLEQPSDAVVESLVIMNKNFGIGYEEAAKVNKVLQNMGGLTQAQAANLSMSVIEMSRLANVAPGKVMRDIADNSGNALKFFRGQPEVLLKSAVSLAAIGSSLESAAKSSEALLDFESSIASELETSALLGADINLEKARAAAFAGDQYGQEKAIMEQLMNIGDLNTKSMYEKESLAKLTGKEVEELINMQRIQKQFPGIDEGRLAAAHAYLDAGADITKLSEKDLDLKNQELKKQQEMQTEFDKSANALSSIGSEFMTALMPVGKFLMDTIVVAISYLKGLWGPVAGAIGNIIDAVNKLFKPFQELFGSEGGGSMMKVFEFIGNVVGSSLVLFFELIAGLVSSTASILSGVFKILKGIFSLDFGMVMEGLGEGLVGVLGFVFRLPIAIFNTLMDMFPSLMASISGWFGSIGPQIKAFFWDLLPEWAQRFLGGATASAASQLQMDSAAPTESVNDGVLQNGNVISTDPADFLIASKNPSALAGQIGGGDGTAALVSSLIAEMQGMRADLAAGKIAVNIDGQKMNAKIAANAVRNPIS